jgi:hypothetical protein
MHQRALDVHLIPEVQESCMPDLAKHCSQNIEKGQVTYREHFDWIYFHNNKRIVLINDNSNKNMNSFYLLVGT